jgi:hypothetical protein
VKKKIGAERYWQLRAKQMEITLYEERKRSAQSVRLSLAALAKMTEMLRAVDGILEAYSGDSLGAGTALRQETAALIRDTGLALGMEGDPETWEIDMTGPDTAAIGVKEPTKTNDG